MRIKWYVQPVPTGQFASFQKRKWPHGFIDGASAVMLTSEKSYSNKIAYVPEDEHISIHIADYRDRPSVSSTKFVWRQLNRKAKTIDMAKTIAAEFFKNNPECLVHSVRGDGIE